MQYKIIFTATEKEFNDLQAKVDAGEFLNIADGARSIYREGYKSMYPAYVKAIKRSEEKDKMTPEARAKAKITEGEALKKVRKETGVETGRGICAVLGGEEVTDESGIPYCEYRRYEDTGVLSVGIKDLYAKEAMEDLQPYHVHGQYFNSMLNESGPKIKEIIIKKINETK